MSEIERAARPRSTLDEKKHESGFGDPDNASSESPSRIEEGGKDHVLLSEEDAAARVRAHPDDATPIYVDWRLNDPTNPRNWPASSSIPRPYACCLTFRITEVEEVVDNMLCQLLEFLDVPMCWRLLVRRTRHCHGVQFID